MSLYRRLVLVGLVLTPLFLLTADASARNSILSRLMPETTFVEFPSIDIEQSPPALLTIKGKLKVPNHRFHGNRFGQHRKVPAVVILHGSSGIDFRGDFHARALNMAGIATLEIDMWEARDIQSPADRPPLPIFNYPDAFAALAFLSQHPDIDPERIGVMGFSWGGVVTMASATQLYSSQFGGGLQFAAHVAHYPVCFAYNSGLPGTEFVELTGAPVLIQIGEEDDYDESSAPCHGLKNSLPEEFQDDVEIAAYDNAYHAFDRLQVPITVNDPFAHLGQGGDVEMIPDPDQAYNARYNAVRFFIQHLRRR